MEKQLTVPFIRKQLLPFGIFILGIFVALLCNQRMSYWLIGLFAHAIVYGAAPTYLMTTAGCALLENFLFLSSSIETAALFGILTLIGLLARKYLYLNLSTVTLITFIGCILQIACIEHSIHGLFIGGLYTLLKLTVTITGVWVVSLTYKLFDR